jgi:hypothetical protein
MELRSANEVDLKEQIKAHLRAALAEGLLSRQEVQALAKERLEPR